MVDLVIRIITSEHEAAVAISRFSRLTNHVYPKLGVNFFAEAVADGALLFYETVKDFIKFHEITGQLPKINPNKRGSPPVTLHSTAIQSPPGFHLQEYISLLQNAYEVLSDTIRVEKGAEGGVDIIYENGDVLEEVFKTIGRLVPEISPLPT